MAIPSSTAMNYTSIMQENSIDTLLHNVGNPVVQILLIFAVFVPLFAVVLTIGSLFSHSLDRALNCLSTYARFAWYCFFKPHTGDGSRSQQQALESFYRAQASIYDATRAQLLQGRADMLGLVAAQVKHRIEAASLPLKPIWIDIGGGTGYNIEAMKQFVDVPNFFEAVYLVDLSPSLCQVATERFARLGWKNAKVVCQDARHFKLDHKRAEADYTSTEKSQCGTVSLVTMSYSLSMIPEYYPIVDSLAALLAPNGVLGVVDFYVQSEVEYQCRNYTGGEIDRHCMWISRVFWRTWFEADRVNLEPARRDYLEYKFGTVLSFNSRCRFLGLRIPYYVWIGCAKQSSATQLKLTELNAEATESPFITALDLHSKSAADASWLEKVEVRSKAYDSAVVNLAGSLPLPASWYQTHRWRLYYDAQAEQHRQFNDEYIYTFTWEDAEKDLEILNIGRDDVVLAITSAGDNVLAYALQQPKRIHAVDLNPAQNHLLELKLASLTALSYTEHWSLFGTGRHPSFHSLLLTKLSPHLSSAAFQFWLRRGPRTFSGPGLYFTGGSGRALRLVQRLARLTGLQHELDALCDASTLELQRRVWQRSLRRVLLSRLLAWAVVSSSRWLWSALGVPPAQKRIIEQDYLKFEGPLATTTEHGSNTKAHAEHTKAGVEHTKTTAEHTQAPPEPTQSNAQATRPNPPGSPSPSPSPPPAQSPWTRTSAAAIHAYATHTLDPVAYTTHLLTSNHYYTVSLRGQYTQRTHPPYISPRGHAALSRPGALDRLRIHTDSLGEVLARLSPATLTIAVLMDSMDWFEPGRAEAAVQVGRLRRALKHRGRVLLRSAGVEPWYIRVFEQGGFVCKRVAVRVQGGCVDRVNMYASTWVCVKKRPAESGDGEDLGPLSLGEARMG